MKKSRFLAIIAVVLMFMLCFTACGQKHACESICDTCGKCTDAACTEDVCADKCAGHKPAGDDNTGDNTGDDDVVKTTPVITVEDDAITINAGMEIDLMELVSVSDSGDPDVKVIISDDNDFDNEVEGVYVITYSAVNKFGNTATATITVTVEKALPIYTLEVQKNILGESKWQGTKLNFKNHEYVEVTANGDYTSSGIYHNGTNAEVTINVESKGYDAVAIIDANGVVLEGRDGPNGKIVNAENPVRISSSATINVNDTGKNIKIPAGCFAVVVKTGYAGDSADTDGRNFIGWNVINYVGNVVRIVVEGQEAPLTPYVDQAPVISGNGNTVFAANSEFVLNDSVLAGVTATDDNGTFDPSDDVPVEVTVVNDGGFNINVQNTYVVTLKAVDTNGNEATATRDVQVTTAVISVTIGSKSYDTLDDLVAIDKELDKVGKYLFIIYTPNFNGTYPADGLNSHGVAVVLNKAGEITRFYDGANGRYLDADNLGSLGYGVDGGVKPGEYISAAVKSLKDGEYLIIAPHANGDVTRKFVLDNGRKPFGLKVDITGFEFAAHECVSVCPNPACGKCLDSACEEAACLAKCECHKCESICAICKLCTDATCEEYYCTSKCNGHPCEDKCEHCGLCGGDCNVGCTDMCAGHLILSIGDKTLKMNSAWAVNKEITKENANDNVVWVFDSTYSGSKPVLDHGSAILLDADGKLLVIYDGANGGYWKNGQNYGSTTWYVDETNNGATVGAIGNPSNFSGKDYTTLAFQELAATEGGTLIILPKYAANEQSGWARGLRNLYSSSTNYFGKVMTITEIESAK